MVPGSTYFGIGIGGKSVLRKDEDTMDDEMAPEENKTKKKKKIKPPALDNFSVFFVIKNSGLHKLLMDGFKRCVGDYCHAQSYNSSFRF